MTVSPTNWAASDAGISAPPFEPIPAAFPIDYIPGDQRSGLAWFVRDRRNGPSVASGGFAPPRPLEMHGNEVRTHSSGITGWIDNWDPDFSGVQVSAREIRQRYWERVQTLRDDGREEGIVLNPYSEKDFFSFVRSYACAYRASLFLLDNGNLRAVWADEDGSRFGLQFLGRGQAHWVISKRRRGSRSVSRAIGTCPIAEISHPILAFGLRAAVFM